MRFWSFPVVVLSTVLVGGVVLGFVVQTSADKVMPIPVEIHEPSGTPHTKSSMQAKHFGAQKVLDGLIHRDFSTIKKGAATLRSSGLANQDRHQTDDRKDKIYEHFRLEFLRLAGKLDDMAEKENIEGAAYTYQNLTATCIACHDHLRDSHRRKHK